MAIDRRVARTRKVLFDALVTLIRSKPYEEITVEDILDMADVARSTFYAHFGSKDDLLYKSLDRLRDLLQAALGSDTSTTFAFDPGWSLSRVLFEHVAEFADIRAALATSPGGVILREAVDGVLAGVLRQQITASSLAGIPRELVVMHVVATINTLLDWRQKHRPQMPADEMDALFRQILRHGLADVPAGFLERPGHSSGEAAKATSLS